MTPGADAARPAVPAWRRSEALDQEVCARARRCLRQAEEVLRGVDPEWAPPPYDPLLIAHALGIRCRRVAAPWVRDALILLQDGQPTILYRPGKDPDRLRFSLFHEIAHTLFPDFGRDPRYAAARRPRLFEPDGQLERLCDLAARELLLPGERLVADLAREGCGAAAVQALSRRYGASEELVGARMVEVAADCCCLGRLEPCRDGRRASLDEVRVVYALPTQQFRASGMLLPPFLRLSRRSCLLQVARSRKPGAGEEEVELRTGDRRRFRIEVLPLRHAGRHRGRSPVLAFFWPC